MGAERFCVEARGKTAQEAFSESVREARYEHGNRGYTGTIAEKSSFAEVALPFTPDNSAEGRKVVLNYVNDLCSDKFADKWGPAGCVQLSDDLFLFFGWASS